jgi:glutamyl/glutaminyl-tRNA synthetase
MSNRPAIQSNFSGSSYLHTTLRSLLCYIRNSITARNESRVARRAFIKTFSLSDRMLDDICVTREEIEWAASLPIRVDAAEALAARARTRWAAESASQSQNGFRPVHGAHSQGLLGTATPGISARDVCP